MEKVGKDLADGCTAQRLIMDLRASNAILQVLTGDISSLSGAPAFTTIALEGNQVVTISGDDLVSSFYLFQLPESWSPYMAFERPVSWKAVGVDREGSTLLGAAVLPMQFASSVGIMQHLHRRLLCGTRRAGLSFPGSWKSDVIESGRSWEKNFRCGPCTWTTPPLFKRWNGAFRSQW